MNTIAPIKGICLFTIFFFSFFSFSYAQVGINTIEPGDGSILDIVSTDKGMLIPRVSIADLSTIAPISVSLAGEESLLVYNTNVSTGKGFYYWDGSDWIAISFKDGDFHEVGTSLPPDLITDNVFRTGNVGIGKTTANYPLDVENSNNTRVMNLTSNGSTAGSIYGEFLTMENTGDGNHFGLYSLMQGETGTGNRYGIYTKINIPGSQSNKAYGIYNDLTATSGGNGEQIGTFNRLGGDGVYRAKTGVSNYITGTDNSTHIGINNNVATSGSGNHIGTQNQVRGTGKLMGVYNTFGNFAGNGENRGVETQNTNDGSGNHHGIYTSLSGNGDGSKNGVSNYISSSGNGAHTGVANTITGSGNGVHTGMYNNINSSTGNNYGARSEIDNTAVGKTSYGTYNWLYNNSGIGYAGWFTSTGSGTNYAAVFNDGLVVANESGNDNDFRIEGQSDNDLLFTDASTDRVGIGTNTPTVKLEVNGKIKATDINFSGIPVYNNVSQANNNLNVGDVWRVNGEDILRIVQ